MQNSRTTARAFKDDVYDAFAQVTKALSSPRRLELLDLLIQGPRSVEGLATGLGQPVGNTSQHLQVLKRAHLVQTTRHGTRIDYELAPGVAPVFVALRRLAEARAPELEVAKQSFFHSADAPEAIDRDTLRQRMAEGSVVLLDVRPAPEFDHAHLEGAVSIPIDELEQRLSELPADRLVVATCRGPYCVFAADAVRTLRARGLAATRLEHGVAEWQADGGHVVAAGEP